MHRALLLFIATIAAMPALAQPESAERRADRLRTIELNSRAKAAVTHRDRANADVREQNRTAMDRYQKQRAEWRKRVDACQNGDWSQCER